MAELTVMTWNVQNLLPVGHAYGPKTPAEYQAKLVALAEVIDAAGPDVLALQEVGPLEVLADLSQACQLDLLWVGSGVVWLGDNRGSVTFGTRACSLIRSADEVRVRGAVLRVVVDHLQGELRQLRRSERLDRAGRTPAEGHDAGPQHVCVWVARGYRV